MTDLLNWLTDPLLIDPIPIKENDWLTANKLIEHNNHSKFFLKPDILNLYSIMVRKHDFLAGERLLQRLPYITLLPDIAYNLRKRSLKLAERYQHYFQKTALEQFLEWIDNKSWKEKIIFITGGMGHEGNILFDCPTIQILSWAILNTKEGRIIVCYGYNIGLVKKSDETWAQTAYRLKERLVKNSSDFLPEILPTDKLIISYSHMPFYDMDNGVFATGSWILKDELRENEGFIKRNIGVFILLDDEDRNDPIKMMRFFDL